MTRYSAIRRIETDDPDEFGAAVNHAHMRYLPLEPTRGRWRLTCAPLGGATLYVGRLGGPTSGFGAVGAGVIFLAFRMRGRGPWTMNGREIGLSSIAVGSGAPEVTLHRDHSVEWAVICLAEQGFARRFRALTGREADLRRGLHLHPSSEPHLGRLRLLAETALSLASSATWDERAGFAFEDMVTEEAVGVVGAPAHAERPEHARLITRCNEFLEERGDAMLTPADLCEALQVGERTLRRFFRDTYGQNPVRFLRVRRLAAARRALSACPAGPSAVTRVATSFGFFELGRFAADYRAVVGESPSQTLRTARERVGRVSENA